jgi:hypothetical protein
MRDLRTFWAAVITAIMWSAVALISIIFMRLADVTAAGAAVFVIIMAGIAIGGTAVVWGSTVATPVTASQARTDSARGTRKSKRLDPERLARLMETLDEDQIIELETLLMAQRENGLDDTAR